MKLLSVNCTLVMIRYSEYIGIRNCKSAKPLRCFIKISYHRDKEKSSGFC